MIKLQDLITENEVSNASSQNQRKADLFQNGMLMKQVELAIEGPMSKSRDLLSYLK